MEIKLIDKQNAQLLNSLFALQIEAYHVEAKLIGSYELPPLKETQVDLQNSNDLAWGLFDPLETLQGAVFLEDSKDAIVITKLVVSVDSFRRGYGQALVQHVLKYYPDRSILVSTGAKNWPARHLYRKLEFTLVSITSTPEMIKIANYVRIAPF